MNFAEALTQMLNGKVVRPVVPGQPDAQFRVVDGNTLQHRYHSKEEWVRSVSPLDALLRNQYIDIEPPQLATFQKNGTTYYWGGPDRPMIFTPSCRIRHDGPGVEIVLARRGRIGSSYNWAFTCGGEDIDAVLEFSRMINADELPETSAPRAASNWTQLEIPVAMEERAPNGTRYTLTGDLGRMTVTEYHPFGIHNQPQIVADYAPRECEWKLSCSYLSAPFVMRLIERYEHSSRKE